jgi:hypothetical protein
MRVDPTDQTHEGCPSWCRRRHEDGDHGDDRAHGSAALIVPAIRRRLRRSATSAEYTVRAVDLVVTAQRAEGDVDTWVQIGDDDGDGLELSAESVRRLHDRLTVLLAEISDST